jgi:hypothetical protein
VTFGNIDLMPGQIELLGHLVEAERASAVRCEFRALRTDQGVDVMYHPGLAGGGAPVVWSDLEELARVGLVAMERDLGSVARITVRPRGFRYYEDLKQSASRPLEQVEDEVRRFLDGGFFLSVYPEVHARWSQAEREMWAAERGGSLSAVGHHCREAMQEFATTLVAKFQPRSVDQNPQHVVQRVGAVLVACAGGLGETEKLVLDTMMDYWNALSGLVQRQEHGGQREKEPLVWEDARRLVFLTGVAMHEIARSLARTPR